MKSAIRVFSLLLVLGMAAASLGAADPPGEYDTVTLKDGRVLKGQVVEERSAAVVMLVRGVHRSFGRDFIAKIAYGDGPGSGGGRAFPRPAGDEAADGAFQPSGAIPSRPPKGGLVAALSARYRVPLGDVLWVRRQGISDADLPMVFLVAATARVVPRLVVKLVLKGWSWDEIESHFQMQPDDVYDEPGPWGDYPYYDPGLDVGYGWDGYWGGYGWGGYYGRGGGWGGGRGRAGGGRGWGGGGGGRGAAVGRGGGGGGRTPIGGSGGNARSGGGSGSHGR